ncbi:D-hexose-6-phosphate mutarotase [Chromatium okenii]|uniref:D-hexose-6-phosphate mutarotase n=1 Tax=Chromatium okenii TaxID=61644 RepID=UPI00190519BB|nr:D-hexose-6-phosphate mutarotase [Chromatium okenii]MBK1640702.1 D-hexose-6-phosphate mutarotase [Chromatium okenii]
MDIAAINARFGVPGSVQFSEGRGGLMMIEIHNDLATATISPYAGQVLAYRPHNAPDELLFVSERAYYTAGKAIKGGIPICWPWFGADPEKKGRGGHGFVRAWAWAVRNCETLPHGASRITLGLTDDDESRAIWPAAFDLTLEITVGATLAVTLTTRNLSTEPLQITQGLHTYFKVGDATQVRVVGLDGCHYLDKAVGAKEAPILQQGAVTVAGEVNRIYEQVPAQLQLEDPVLNRRIIIDGAHSNTCVVWNPWVETAHAMDDLDDRDYLRFICVETVNTASEVIEILPQAEAHIGAEYRIELLAP